MGNRILNIRSDLLNNKSENKTFSNLCVIILFGVFLFVASEENLTQGEIFTFYLNFNKSYIIFVLLVIGLLVSYNFNIIIDKISFNLILRLILFVAFSVVLVLTGLLDTEYQIGILMTYFVTVFAYLWGKKLDKNFIAKLLFVCLIIIFLQIIITYFGKKLSFDEVTFFKWSMVIPLGQTNTIGCYLVGMVIYICSSSIKRICKIFAFILSLCSIIFTLSRSGICCFGIYSIYLAIKWLNTKKTKIFNVLLLICAFFIISVCVYLLFGNKIISRFDWESLTYSRFQVYKEGFELFINYPITGVTAYKFYIYDAYKAHNWILESLIESGLIVSVIYFYCIYLSIKGVKKNSQSFLPFVIIYLIHGLVEPNLFTIGLDSFFWLLIGSLQNNKKYYEKNIRYHSYV